MMSDPKPNLKIMHELVEGYEPIHGHIPMTLHFFIVAALDKARADERRKLANPQRRMNDERK